MLFIYRILSILFYPLIALYIFYRASKGRENRQRILERFGFSSIERPKGDIIWIHAVSVGETNSALILVDELLKTRPEISILFTTTTVTSAEIMAGKIQNYQSRVIHQFLSVDSYICVKGFLQFWQPKIALFVESEIWPNLIWSAAKKYKIPTFLINARMSDKSFKRWNLARKFGVNIFSNFTKIFTQTLQDEKRFFKLSQKPTFFFGNLKSQAQTLNFDENELQNLAQKIGNRKFWLAASTHKGEEEKIIAVHKRLRQKFPDLLTILVPRHPKRAEEIKAFTTGLKIAQRSQNQDLKDEIEIYLADTLGELALFYKLSDFAFIGGSLVDVGGHNPYEAIKLDCAVISGSKFTNFVEIYDKLSATNSCEIARNKNELCDVVEDFLRDENLYKTQLQNAKNAIKDESEIAAKIVAKLEI